MALIRHSLAAIGAAVGAPVALGVMALRPGWRVGVRERLGVYPPIDAGRVWVHAASVGECFAAAHLVQRLCEEGESAFASAWTPGGLEVLGQSLSSVPRALAPFDHPWCVDSALSRVRPCLLALVETELWPVWIHAAHRRGIPVVIVSGRLSDRSFPRYRRLRWALARTLTRLQAVGARSDVDAERFVALGVAPEKVSVTGDLKLESFDRGSQLAPELAKALSGAPFFVAGSTHAGEERAAENALRACEASGICGALVVAPRHLHRVDAIERELRAVGRVVRRRSDLGGAPLASGQVLLLDSVGELAAVYAHAVVAFVGGTLVPVGGHNVSEPLFAGCPVLYGPHIANVRAAVEIAERSEAGVRVPSSQGLAAAVVEVMHDPERGRERGARGRELLEGSRGSVDRTAELVLRTLRDARARREGPAC